MATTTYRVHGMDCAEEVATLRAALGPIPGVHRLSFDILNSKMSVDVDETQVTSERVIDAAMRAGMRIEPWDANPVEKNGATDARRGRTTSTVLSGGLLATGFIAHVLSRGLGAAFRGGQEDSLPLAVKLLYVGAVVAGAWHVAPKAVGAIRRHRPDINLLMTAAVIGAVAIGEYLEAGVVSFLFAVSLSLEAWSISRARRAIGALMSLAPETASVLDESGRETSRPVADVSIGSRILIRPGSKIPLDGTVAKGDSTVNQAPITGESMPVPKASGDNVYAGTINEEGALEVITSKVATDTTLARIIRMVGDAQSKRSPSEQWVERFARYYTPTVLVAAILVILLPPLALDGIWSVWFYRGLVLLVIACPCALVISTPVSIVAALASAARAGVLIKGGPFIEAPAQLKAIAIDKTGTLTVGQPEVRFIEATAGHTESEVLQIAAAIEARSEHPLARAVMRAASAKGIHSAAAEDFQSIKGKGATAKIGDQRVWLGSHRLLEERAQETAEIHARLEEIENDGSSVIVLGTDDNVLGWIALADTIRPEAKDAIAAWRRAGLEHVIMLTGDNQGTGNAIGRLAGVDEVRAELLPEEKVAAIEELVRRYGHVAMIGDGVNDAPAMARSSLGIAMGAVGTDAALETADIALMRDDLSMVGWLIRHSRQTLNIIRQNIWFSLSVKAAFLGMTLTGYSSLWAAIGADMGASLLVIFNALRLLNYGRTDGR